MMTTTTQQQFEAELNQLIDRNDYDKFVELIYKPTSAMPLKEIIKRLVNNAAQIFPIIHKLCSQDGIDTYNMLQSLIFYIEEAFIQEIEAVPIAHILSVSNTDGLQPIHVAAQHQLINTITFLQNNNVDTSTIDSNGNNIIHHFLQSVLLQAPIKESVDGLWTILNYDQISKASSVNTMNQNGQTPLHLALMLQESPSKLEIVKMLLEQKADPLLGEPPTAIHIALQQHCPIEYIQLLVDKAKSSPLLTEQLELDLQETARTVGASPSLQELLLNGWRPNIAPVIEEAMENKDGVVPCQPDVSESPKKKLKVENKRRGSQKRLDSRSPRAEPTSSSSSRRQCVVPENCPNVELFNSFLEVLRQHIHVNDPTQFGDAVQYFHDALVEYCTGNSSSSRSHQGVTEASIPDVIIEDSNG